MHQEQYYQQEQEINNMNYQNIESFIKGIQNEGTIIAFTEGYCYWFAEILIKYAEMNLYRTELIYHPIKNHFAVRINERAFDITGQIDDIGYERWVDYCFSDTDSARRVWNNCVLKEY